MTPDTEEAYEIQLTSGRRVVVRGYRVGDFAVRRLGFDVAGVTTTNTIVTARHGTYVIDHLPSGFSAGPFNSDADPEGRQLVWAVADVFAIYADGLKTAEELCNKIRGLCLEEWIADYLAAPIPYRQWLEQQKRDKAQAC